MRKPYQGEVLRSLKAKRTYKIKQALKEELIWIKEASIMFIYYRVSQTQTDITQD